VTTSYIWCGARRCQARNAAGAPTRDYFKEGELIPSTQAQPLCYYTDQIGAIRRMFSSASSAPSYGYDPYGNALQETSLLTAFGYAEMFYNSDSGLYLTRYRAYDPAAGRWLSLDPSGGQATRAPICISTSMAIQYPSWIQPAGSALSESLAARSLGAQLLASVI
jgi:RHS repeat-associated protein